ncbi:MAG: MoaD/ThiS family protein [Marmoricola sp.]
MATVVVRYFASARAASGVPEEQCEAATVDEVLAEISSRHGDRLTAILNASSLLLNGARVADRSMALPESAELEVLPPFAGG